MADTLQIDANIPAGNIIVERIDGDDVYMQPDLRDTEGHWFYWHCRVRGGGGRHLRFHLTSEFTLTSSGPAISYDRGRTWAWLGADSMDEWSFGVDLPAGADDIRLSMGMPYTQSRLDAFIDTHGGNPRFAAGVLCTSRKGRPVAQLRAGCLWGEPAHRVLLTARHHCCEMMASYAIEGVIEGVVADDETGRWFGENVELMAVPFVDTDGVTDGDQGKNRRPRDHNRDYAGESIYAETAAIRADVPTWGGGKLHATVDLHCPWIRGADHNECIYIVGSPEPRMWVQQQRFGELLQQCNRGPLPYRAEDNLPYGEAWNVGTNEDSGCSCGRWALELPDVRLAASIELPYAVARGAEVNQETAKAFGRDLAECLRRYLHTIAS